MSFGPSNFNDPLNVGAVSGADNREQAKLRGQAFLSDSNLGGQALGTFAQDKAGNILNSAQKSAQSTMNTASAIGGAISLAGSIGSFGAAGGFDPSKTFMNNIFGSTPIGAGGGTLPKFGLFGKETVGTLGPNYGIPQN